MRTYLMTGCLVASLATLLGCPPAGETPEMRYQPPASASQPQNRPAEPIPLDALEPDPGRFELAAEPPRNPPHTADETRLPTHSERSLADRATTREPLERAPEEVLAPQRRIPADNGAVGGGRTHVVLRGETLYRIAQQYYGDGSRWREIYAANREQLPAPERLQVAMRLLIP